MVKVEGQGKNGKPRPVDNGNPTHEGLLDGPTNDNTCAEQCPDLRRGHVRSVLEGGLQRCHGLLLGVLDLFRLGRRQSVLSCRRLAAATSERPLPPPLPPSPLKRLDPPAFKVLAFARGRAHSNNISGPRSAPKRSATTEGQSANATTETREGEPPTSQTVRPQASTNDLEFAEGCHKCAHHESTTGDKHTVGRWGEERAFTHTHTQTPTDDAQTTRLEHRHGWRLKGPI